MKNILVVGSLHYDIMVNSPHRPETGETVIGLDCNFKFGGKGGNQAIAAAKEGIHTRFIGAIGDDENGGVLLKVLKKNSINTDLIEIIPDTLSGISVAITDIDNDYSAVVIPNANNKINIDQFYTPEVWREVDLLLLQNELPDEVNLIASQEARKRGIKVCLNAAPARVLSEKAKSYIDVLVVNAIEARDMSGIAVNDLASATEAAIFLSSDYPVVIVTAGEHGVAFSEKNKSYGSVPAEKVKLISTHGAGDCFMGVLCASFINQVDLKESIHNANKAAALHVSQRK